MIELSSALGVHPSFGLKIVRIGEQIFVVICYGIRHSDSITSWDCVPN